MQYLIIVTSSIHAENKKLENVPPLSCLSLFFDRPLPVFLQCAASFFPVVNFSDRGCPGMPPPPICCLRLVAEIWCLEKYLEILWMPVPEP
jgi:hypothetical protein